MRRRFLPVPMLVAALVAACTAWAAETPADPNAPLNEAAYGGKIKVACVGDSITLGIGTTPEPARRAANNPNFINAYPLQLGRMLGAKYELKSFPYSGHTLMASGDKPFSKEKEYQASLDYKPDVVIIMLGTNDTKTTPNNWQHKDEFVGDYKAFVGKYLAADPKPRVFLCNPPWVRKDGLGTINEADVVEEIPMIATVAKDLKLGVIDIHGATKGHDEFYAASENVHPNSAGAEGMAKTIYHSLTGKEYTGPSAITTAASAPVPASAPASRATTVP
jgi:lysophospholipase L1-like esterase